MSAIEKCWQRCTSMLTNPIARNSLFENGDTPGKLIYSFSCLVDPDAKCITSWDEGQK